MALTLQLFIVVSWLKILHFVDPHGSRVVLRMTYSLNRDTKNRYEPCSHWGQDEILTRILFVQL